MLRYICLQFSLRGRTDPASLHVLQHATRLPRPLVYLSTTRRGRTGRASLHRYHGRIAGQRLFGVRARCRRLMAEMLFVALRKIGGRGEAHLIRDL